MNSKKNGYLIAPCSAGKTFMALKIVEKMSKVTLIIVDEIMLLEQWKEDIINLCKFDVEKALGEISGSKKDFIDKDVILATKQSLLNDKNIFDYLKENVSFVIIDECHTSPTEVFTQILEGLKPKYRLGLTATPERSDGFDFLLKSNIGPILDEIKHKELQKIGSILEPTIQPILVLSENKRIGIKNWDKKIKNGKKPMIDWKTLVREVLETDNVHYAIADNIFKQYENGRYAAVILAEIKWIDKYYKYLTETKKIPKEHIEIIRGETEKDYRKEIINKAKIGEIKILLTSKLLDKGVSINILDCIHLVYPSKATGNVEQRVGRIVRTHPNKKQPIVFDYVFDNYVFFHQFFNKYTFCRFKAYRKFSKTEKIENFVKTLERYFLSSTFEEREYERNKIIDVISKEKKENFIIVQ